MLSRKDFFKSCALAACGSALCPSAGAQDTGKCDPNELKEAAVKIDAVRYRFAKLVEEIASGVPGEVGNRLIRGLGHQCAATYKANLLDRFKGDIHGFLAEGRRSWMAEADYDEAAGTIRIVDKQKACVCPAVKQGETPGRFCECTLGWQEAAYSTVLGRPVKAELEESILRGGKRCIYRITVL